MKPRRLAQSLVRRYKTRDPFAIAGALGYLVIRTPLTGIRGFWHHTQRQHILCIDDRLPEREQAFVCAHELGHVLLHRGCNRLYLDSNTYFPVNRQEIEANRFAAQLLFDDEDLRFFLDYPVKLAADHMGIPTELAAYRLESIPH